MKIGTQFFNFTFFQFTEKNAVTLVVFCTSTATPILLLWNKLLFGHWLFCGHACRNADHTEISDSWESSVIVRTEREKRKKKFVQWQWWSRRYGIPMVRRCHGEFKRVKIRSFSNVCIINKDHLIRWGPSLVLWYAVFMACIKWGMASCWVE